MNTEEAILELVKRQGILRPREAEAAGLHGETLRRLFLKGKLERIGRGLYTIPGALGSESVTLAEVAKRVPGAVICLLSALQFHNLTTQLPHEVWIALESTAWRPKMDYPRLRIARFSGKAFHFGIEEHIIDNVSVKVYTPAKTVADCFKFRNKVGLDVALEALRETWRERRATADQLWIAAKACRVQNVIRPYLEATVT